jgi:uncharacterized protein YxjI
MTFPTGRSDLGGGPKYRLRRKLLAFGDDYWIETDGGERAFRVDGKALRIRRTLVLETPDGAEVLTLREKKLSIRDKIAIERGDHTVATVEKALFRLFRERFSIAVEGGGDLTANGNILDHEYRIERDGHVVAEVSKRWFSIRDAYGIELAPAQDDALILAIAVCIDQMTQSVG